jgi:hypothetical protein
MVSIFVGKSGGGGGTSILHENRSGPALEKCSLAGLFVGGVLQWWRNRERERVRKREVASVKK